MNDGDVPVDEREIGSVDESHGNISMPGKRRLKD